MTDCASWPAVQYRLASLLSLNPYIQAFLKELEFTYRVLICVANDSTRETILLHRAIKGTLQSQHTHFKSIDFFCSFVQQHFKQCDFFFSGRCSEIRLYLTVEYPFDWLVEENCSRLRCRAIIEKQRFLAYFRQCGPFFGSVRSKKKWKAIAPVHLSLSWASEVTTSAICWERRQAKFVFGMLLHESWSEKFPYQTCSSLCSFRTTVLHNYRVIELSKHSLTNGKMKRSISSDTEDTLQRSSKRVAGQNESSFSSLPIELAYRILNYLDPAEVFLSVFNVCRYLNSIIDTYDRYQVN